MSRLTIERVPSAGDRTLPVFAEFDQVADRIRRRAYQLFTGRGFGEGHALDDWIAAEHQICWPAAELVEKEDGFELKVALAGFESNEINVTAAPGELIIKASHESRQKEEEEGEKSKIRWSEFRSNDVYRHVELPGEVDVDKVKAEYKNGLLTIEAPRTAKAKAPSQQVKISSAA